MVTGHLTVNCTFVISAFEIFSVGFNLTSKSEQVVVNRPTSILTVAALYGNTVIVPLAGVKE